MRRMETMGESNDSEKEVEEVADIYELFNHYNSLYFDDALGSCLLNWSSTRHMMSCTGACHYDPEGGCEILLSEPLLKFCSIVDLKNALLHEMIHAFLWVKHKNKDHSDHGSSFQEIRNSIDYISVVDHQRPHGGYNVTLHHEFKKEVSEYKAEKEIRTYRYRQWICDTCGDSIKKIREPSARDFINKASSDKSCVNLSCHWHNHKNEWSGSYTIAELPGYKEKETSLKAKQDHGHDKFACMTRQTAERESETEAIKRNSDGKMDSEGEQDLQGDDLLHFMTGQDKRKLRQTGRMKGKSDGKRAMRIVNYFQPVKNAKRNQEDNASSSDESQKGLDGEQSEAASPERPKEVSKHAPMRKQRHTTSKKRKGEGKWKNEDATASDWFCLYGDEDEDETIEPLRNKRTEERKRLKLLQSAAEKCDRN